MHQRYLGKVSKEAKKVYSNNDKGLIFQHLKEEIKWLKS
ncbi:hypothetical protein B4102_1913 [Heyndrickxia sporothermodurans]|uniref:Uncharacterized protein n=1 Tax=Heyndrickxia sporothermodurans TaxID=46224 RepID=A0A150LB85_9BACI|nr:hypothetical protein B4102_1913 [Heyndrickxia sporothermodurans]